MESGYWTGFRAILSILQWWAFNVTVIIMNKWIFQKLDFKFPLSVSCVHFICSSLGAYLVIKVLKIKPLIEVDPEDRWRRIFPMSFVFCINIVLGNISLRYIPVSFMQTVKSFTPATTVFLQWLVWGKSFDLQIWSSLVPIVGGILLTSITELSFNIFGFCAALFGCLATSTKTILAESLLHGYKFDSINTVFYMAPFATMILAVPALLLEGVGVLHWLQTHDQLGSSLMILFSSGVFAFCLNFSIFFVIHSTTAVTFNVAGNLKVAVAIMVSWLIFRNPISALNMFGCAITLIGCTFYGYVRHKLSQGAAQVTVSTKAEDLEKQMEALPLDFFFFLGGGWRSRRRAMRQPWRALSRNLNMAVDDTIGSNSTLPESVVWQPVLARWTPTSPLRGLCRNRNGRI
ncbi:UDP-galactose transporter 1-like isoform X13 [Nymphaea colorata]|nr:UDP-galactose transporter 1-like isoform X2 [Nymphaea colorata]XP_049935520.1 UDP-galactose transporter 1-like isoform X1 [Nymphaea colorata]XP_049935522.1 UDP-galactose transporter 1-like isoform X4 [Nymphaea colorata]XP_049935523.1 UDP-galactose transporter 1-like isoform X5 [Nymphaea colorata]XP_049935524.1 UDP-galactose transporter 1-like isoform X6 [Nymphaea colorata]XP_049935525.1 UDP-galactose transporter 1-like isoform X7 [Nymphaea colorata]XP_049935528.1 UDP-galactose transporter 